MKSRSQMRPRVAALAAAAFVVVVLVSTASAGPAGAVKTFTGCLVAGDSVIIKIKEGESPKSTCNSGQTLARISGGDITRISVTGALTLTNGGESGDVEINLDPKHTLPQGCSSGQVAKRSSTGTEWSCAFDENTTYSAGAGLALSGTEFSLDPAQQLPEGCELGQASAWTLGGGGGAPVPGWHCRNFARANETCPSGAFARATNSTGDLVCATPSASGGGAGSASQAKQANFTSGDGVPDDGVWHTYVTLSLDAGTHMVTGKGVLRRDDDDIGFADSAGIGCRLVHGTEVADETAFTPEDNDAASYGFTLIGVVAATGGDVTLECIAEDDADLVSVRYAKLVALEVA